MIAPRRVFLGWDGAVLPRVAEHLLAAHGSDLSALVVVVPGRRSGRLLLSHLALRLGRGGGPQQPSARESAPVPPRIVTPGALPELFFRPERTPAGRYRRVLAWATALAQARPGSLPGAGARAEARLRLAFARELVRAQDELAAEGLRLADVPSRAAAAVSAAGAVERWRTIAELERSADAELARSGEIDPGEARLEALARGGHGTGLHVVLCAVTAVRALERALLARFAAAVTVLVAAPEEAAGLFDEWGGVELQAWGRRRVALPPQSLLIGDRPRDLARRLASSVAAAVSGAGGEDDRRDRGRAVTVGLADSTLAPVVTQALLERGLEPHDAVGRPLAQTAPWLALAMLGRYAETRGAGELAALLRLPDLERWLGPALERGVAGAPLPADPELRRAIEERDWLTALDLYTTATALGPVEPPLPGEAAGAALVEALVSVLAETVGPPGAREPLARWLERIEGMARRVWGERVIGSAGGDLVLRRSLARLGEELRALAAAAAAGERGHRLQFHDAVGLLLAEVASEPLAGDGGTGAVEILGWLELPLDDAPRLVVAGLDESAAAAAHRGGLFEPALRRELGLQEERFLYARDLYYLELLASSRDATFVCARRGAQGEPLVPRRTLLAAPTPSLVERVLAFWGGGGGPGTGGEGVEAGGDEREQAAAGAGPGGDVGSGGGERAGRAAAVMAGEGAAAGSGGYRRGGFAPIQPTAAAPLPERLPVTAFRDYLACPYRFYLRHVLGLRRMVDLPRELLPGDFGRLLHAVLGRFARGPAASSDDADEVMAALERDLADEARRRVGTQPRAAVRLQLEQLRRRLHAFAGWQAEQVRSGWRIVPERAEARLAARLDVDGTPFQVVGRVDRVDRHPSHGIRLLDYKSGEQGLTPEQVHRSGRGGERRWVDLQLPLYELMLRQSGTEGALELGFVNLGQRLEADPLALAAWSEAELAEARRVASGVVRAVRARRFWPPGDPPAWSDGFEALVGDLFPDRELYLGRHERR